MGLRLFTRSSAAGNAVSGAPDYIVFHSQTGTFAVLKSASDHLSFRLEHPAHLCCDVRVKNIYFGLAKHLHKTLTEVLASPGHPAPANDAPSPARATLTPDFHESPRGLVFGEGTVWDEWTLADSGTVFWDRWLEDLAVGGDARPSARRARRFLEIGFGSGDFLSASARAKPHDLFTGVESSAESIQYAAKKVRDLRNVRLVHADALSFLRSLTPVGGFNGIYIHFPYPWNKRRHRRRRLIRKETLPLMENALTGRGLLRIVTDSEAYARQSATLIRGSRNWSAVRVTASAPRSLRSRYLTKWQKEGRRIFTISARRQAGRLRASAKGTPDRRLGMTSLRDTIARFALAGSQTPVPSEFIAQLAHRVIRLEGTYIPEKREDILLRLFVVLDDGIGYRLYLLLQRDPDGMFALRAPSGARFSDVPHLRDLLDKLLERLSEESLGTALPEVFEGMLSAYGPQGWWPQDPEYHLRERSDYRDEIAVGAILTQATTWRNVERALARLKERGALSLNTISRLPRTTLIHCLEPARFPAIKAARLLAFVHAFSHDFGASWDTLKSTTSPADRRQWLLNIHGIGEETADSILLYALGDAVFVIDAYTRRLFRRLGYCTARRRDAPPRALVESALNHRAERLAEFHALIVHHAKTVCNARAPLCSACAVADLCAFPRSSL
jgi:endonuclease-3 related protein